MEERKPILWNRNFVQCCISYFLMNFSFYLLMPTMPVYLVEVLGIDTAEVGIVLSSYTIGLLCVRPFSGFLVDCFSRKPLYLFAFFVFAMMFGGYLFAATMLTIMAVRFVQGGFMGLTSVAGNTIAIDVIPSRRRGEGMGFYGLTINLAMSLAPLVAVAIYDKWSFHPVVMVGLVAAFVGVGSVCLIRYPKREKVPRPHFSLDRFILVKALPAALAYVLVAIPYGMITSFVVLYGKEIEVADPGYFFIYMAIGVGTSRLISGRLVDHGKIHWVSVCSSICLLVTFTVFATVHQSWVFFACALMIGIGYGVGVPAFQCLFVNVAPHNMRGTATSTYLTSFDFGVGIGMLAAGFIASHAGLAAAYGVGAGCCLASLCVYLRWVKPSYEKHKLLHILLLICPCLPCFCQQTVDERWVASMGREYAGFPSELVYLQTSKGIYETGEDLWFKAYQLNSQSLALSSQSRTLYLQMINCRDSIVWQEKYPVENGMAFGHVYVSEKLAEGDYYLEAYTRHSFHHDTTGIISSRKVKVVKNIAYDSQQPKNLEKDSLRFEVFPEGGNLVSGLPSRVAFKATNGSGYPVEVKGALYQGDTPLTRFASSHDGMGAFFFTPDSEKKYHITLENGTGYSLPEIYHQGMTLRLSKQNKKYLEFFISQTEGLPAQEVCLLGQIRGMVCCVAKGMLKDQLKIKMPLSEFPYQGIAEFTLFNDSMQPVAERLVYVNPEKKLQIHIEPDKKEYALREKATLKIKVTDEGGAPVKANLGISVFDKAYINPEDPVNILTYCYLSSQIRGKIHNPLYYFDETKADRLQALDLLLLTQGWRRYVWNSESLANQGPEFLTDGITGVQWIQSKKKRKQEPGTEQLIQISGAEGNAMFVWVDSAGQFTIEPDMMKELQGGYVYLKPMLSKDFKTELQINDLFLAIDTVRESRTNYYPVIELAQEDNERIFVQPIVSKDSTILLDEVTVTGKSRRAFRDKFMGRLDSLAQMNLNSAYVCTSCGRLLNYKTGYDAHHAINSCPAEGRMQPIDGKKYLISKYEHYASNGSGTPFRVIDQQYVVYHASKFSEEELLRMNNLWRTKGYYAVREFYQPDEIDMQLSTPDARNTLLWEPFVITNEKGEAEVSFYCSDINSGFTGVVEGVDGTGLLGSGKCEFRIVRE